MLVNFRFENFKSFRDEANLDLQATSISESSFHVRNCGNNKILPLAAIYGANASGKSNVIEAFKYMATYVIDSFSYGDMSAEKRPYFRPILKPFAFGKSGDIKQSFTEFEVWFTIPGDEKEKTFNYGFVLGSEDVEEEWLNVKAKTAKEFRPVYYRDGQSIEFNNKTVMPVVRQEVLRETVNPQTLVVSLGAKLGYDVLKKVRDWFLECTVLNFGNPIVNAIISRTITPEFTEDENVRKEFVEFLSMFDSSIVNFEINEYKDDESEQDSRKFDINAFHRNEDGDEVAIKLEDESEGTLKMFALYPFIREALEKGTVLLIDELNSRLHPLLVRMLEQMFASPEKNPNNAQLIFTSHDIWQLKDNVLRRDEIWFTDKNIKGISELYSLFDFEDEKGEKIRKDEDHQKNYLLGKYGGIPSLKEVNVLK